MSWLTGMETYLDHMWQRIEELRQSREPVGLNTDWSAEVLLIGTQQFRHRNKTTGLPFQQLNNLFAERN